MMYDTYLPKCSCSAFRKAYCLSLLYEQAASSMMNVEVK